MEGEKLMEDVDRDGQLGVTIALPEDPLDTPQDALGDRRLDGIEGVPGICMEGADGRQV